MNTKMGFPLYLSSLPNSLPPSFCVAVQMHNLIYKEIVFLNPTLYCKEMSHAHTRPYFRQRGKSHLNDSQSLQIIENPQQSLGVMASLMYRQLSGG